MTHELSPGHEILSSLNLSSKLIPVPIYCTGILSTGPSVVVLSDPHVSSLHVVWRTRGKGMLCLEHRWTSGVGWPGVAWGGVTARFCCTDISAACQPAPELCHLQHSASGQTYQRQIAPVCSALGACSSGVIGKKFRHLCSRAETSDEK